jgi:tetratricopeptide (TPR) repeat protein
MRFTIFFCLLTCLLCSLSAQRKKKNNATENTISKGLTLRTETLIIEGSRLLILGNYSAARTAFEQANELDPNNAVVNFKLAELDMIFNASEAALIHINQAIALDAQNKFYLIFKGDILSSLNRYEDLVEVYIKLIDLSGNQQYYFDLGALYQFQKKWNEALEAYEKGQQLFGISEEIMRERQKIYLQKNDIDALEKDWERLIAQAPDEIRYVLELCSMLIMNKAYDQAMIRLLAWDDPNAKLLISQIALQQKDYDKAMIFLKEGFFSQEAPLLAKIQLLDALIEKTSFTASLKELLEQLLEIYPEQFEAFTFVGDVYLKLGETTEALLNYRKAIAVEGADYKVWQQVISMELHNLEYDSVILHCDQALEYYPNQALFYFYNGVAYYSKKEFGTAIRFLSYGRKYVGDSNLLGFFYAQLGDAHNALEQHTQSDEAYEKALEIDPNNEHVLNNYSYFLCLRNQQLLKAQEMAKKLIQKYPESATYLDTYGWVLYTMKQYEEAEIYLKKAAFLDENGTVIEHYGDVLSELGKFKEALTQWIRAKKLGGTTDSIGLKIKNSEIHD